MKNKHITEQSIINFSIIALIFSLIIGIYMATNLSIDDSFTDNMPGSLLKATHVHLIGEVGVAIFLALIFKKIEFNDLNQIKNLGFLCIATGFIFHPLGLIGKGYKINILIKLLRPAEYIFVGGLIILATAYYLRNLDSD